jgi:trehalose synthase
MVLMILEKYEKVIGSKGLEELHEAAHGLTHRHIVHISSSFTGGGVTEILQSMVPIMNELGLNTGWRFLKGNPDFFGITKKFHNALQGGDINLSDMKRKIYFETNRYNSTYTHISHHDCVIVHDPQPLPLINFYSRRQPWIWRCHVDLSKPNPKLWNYLRPIIEKYSAAVVSKKQFQHKLKIPQHIIHPSIDPLSQKNLYLKSSQIDRILRKFNIPLDKPIIAQVSRFDKWKDPCGVIRTFKKIREKYDCRLVLLGSMATDDPEGQKMYESVLKDAEDDPDIVVLSVENDTLVNALQRKAEVILQKSIKEGFGLTVSESLWKRTPVVAGNVGGIPLQVKHNKTGYLVNNIDQAAKYTLKILNNPKLKRRLGKAGEKHVKDNFLINRHILDWFKLLDTVFKNDKRHT